MRAAISRGARATGRLLPHVADQAELNALRIYYPLQNYVLALYHTRRRTVTTTPRRSPSSGATAPQRR